MSFKDYPRKVYKRTFLNTVFVVFSYSVDFISEELLSSVNQFLRENFNTQEDVKEDIFRKGFTFDNEEKGISFFFSSKHLGVKYLKDDYVSFPQTMMPLVYPLISFLKNVVFVESISEISIRKANLWSVKCEQDKGVDEDKFVKDFLSEELISKAESTGESKILRNARGFHGKTDQVDFFIKYGFLDSTLNEEKYCGLVLDESVKLDNVQTTETEGALISANITLYNIFHWSVSKQTLAYMDKEI